MTISMITSRLFRYHVVALCHIAQPTTLGMPDGDQAMIRLRGLIVSNATIHWGDARQTFVRRIGLL